jgi:hypothetical protein
MAREEKKMNRTQKGACFCIAMSIFAFALLLYIYYRMAIATPLALQEDSIKQFWFIPVFIILISAFTLFISKKQSPQEPKADERDNIIKLKAALFSFISIFVLMAIKIIVIYSFLGVAGAVYVYFLPLIDLALVFIVLLVYSIAIIAQYGFRGNNA